MPPSDSLVFEVVLEHLYPFGRYIGKGYTLSALVLFQVVAASWYSQIDYGIEALIKQYNRFLQGKPTNWRMPVDVLSIRFEGILRDMVADYGGRVTKVGRDNSTCQALLDDLLREPRLQEVFKKEDMCLQRKVIIYETMWRMHSIFHRITEWYRQHSYFCVSCD